MRRFLPLFAAALTSACATATPPPRVSLDDGMLIARVEARGALMRKQSDFADAAKVVPVDASNVPIYGEHAASAYASDGYVLFFGLPPGRYALRSASFRARGARYLIPLPEGVDPTRVVTLKRGGVAFMGDHSFDSRWTGLGRAFKRAVSVAIRWAIPIVRRPTVTRDGELRSVDAGRTAEIEALQALRPRLARTQWGPIIVQRLRELGAPEPPKQSGGFFSHEFPLREEKLFSWRDTLKWGEPRRAETGLAWRKPGSDAQIAVFFTTASAAGFGGWDAAVLELRRSAAASVEDKGRVYEVQVATRAGVAARATKHRYREGVLVGSAGDVTVTETVLVPDGYGVFTARMRASRAEFEGLVPAFREFLLQLALGTPKVKVEQRQEEVVLPFAQ